MTWHYLIADDGSSMEIWDHTQDPKTDTPLRIKELDVNNRKPDQEEVVEIMDEEVTSELPEQANAGNAGNGQGLSQRGGFILRDMARQKIEEYEP